MLYIRTDKLDSRILIVKCRLFKKDIKLVSINKSNVYGYSRLKDGDIVLGVYSKEFIGERRRDLIRHRTHYDSYVYPNGVSVIGKSMVFIEAYRGIKKWYKILFRLWRFNGRCCSSKVTYRK